MPRGSLGYDLEPKCRGVKKADFLKTTIITDRRIVILGNPPFGRRSETAIRFFNHAAGQAVIIAFILPLTFRKPGVQSRLNPFFHLIHEEVVPRDAFLFRGKSKHVPTVFQIWAKRDVEREFHNTETHHPDFEFIKTDGADFATQRIGVEAGENHDNLLANINSHHRIVDKTAEKGSVRGIMEQLDFANVAANVVGQLSLAKAEIVALYKQFIKRQSATA